MKEARCCPTEQLLHGDASKDDLIPASFAPGSLCVPPVMWHAYRYGLCIRGQINKMSTKLCLGMDSNIRPYMPQGHEGDSF